MDRARPPLGVLAVPVDVDLVPAQRDAARSPGPHGISAVLVDRGGGDLLDRVALIGREQNGDELAAERLAVHGDLAGHIRPTFTTPGTREQAAEAKQSDENRSHAFPGPIPSQWGTGHRT